MRRYLSPQVVPAGGMPYRSPHRSARVPEWLLTGRVVAQTPAGEHRPGFAGILQDFDPVGLDAFLALAGRDPHRAAFRQRGQTRPREGAGMDEDVLAAAIR